MQPLGGWRSASGAWGRCGWRLERGRDRGAVRAAFRRPAAPRADRAPRAPRREHGAALDPAQHQNRRLRGGLQVLPAVSALRHRPGGREADGPGRGACCSGNRQGQRRDALLHGRRLALAQGAPHGAADGDGQRGQVAGPGDLRDRRHAQARAGPAAEVRWPRLLQPQPRHLAGVLRRDHHHAHLPGPPGHAGSRARDRHEGLLRAASSAWARAAPSAPA